MSQNHAFLFLLFPWNYNIPVEKGLKLNVHKTFRRRLLNVLCTFNLRPVSIGTIVRVMVLCSHWLWTVSKLMTKFEKHFEFKSLDDPGPILDNKAWVRFFPKQEHFFCLQPLKKCHFQPFFKTQGTRLGVIVTPKKSRE